jgi:exonuclease SbcC
MRIKRIRLKNVKSYHDQTIPFHDGVNFISGANGSGKTTIVESIGYTLFGCKPEYRFGDFIRHGQRRGEIEIWVEANDEREYRVVRRFSTRGSQAWMVFDEETGMEIESGEADVRDWLRENLGLGMDADLEDLFKTVIGVRQGTFVAPFLARPKERERYFNSILNLESYRDAYERTREAEGVLRSEIGILEEKIKILSERTQAYERTKEELEEINSNLNVLEAEITRMDSILSERKKLLGVQQELYEEITTREQEIGRLERRIERAKTELEGIRDKIQEAQKAAEIVRASEPDHRRFLQIEAELKELESQRKERDSLREKAQSLERTISSLQTRADELTRIYDERCRQLDAEAEMLQCEIEEVESQINTVSQALEELDVRLNRFEGIEVRLSDLKRIERDLEREAQDASQMKGRLDELSREREKLVASLSHLDALKGEVARGEEIERNLERSRAELAALEERLRAARKNARSAKGGRCPLLSIPCPAVEGGDLEAFFEREIRSLKEEISKSKEELKSLEAEVRKVRDLRDELIKLEGDRARLKQVEEELENISGRLSRLIASVDIAHINGLLSDLRDKLVSEGMGLEIEYMEPPLEDLRALGDELRRIIEIAENRMRESLERVRNDRETTSGQLSALKADRKTKLKRLSQVKSQRKKLEQTLSEIESLRKEIRFRRVEHDSISEQLERYEGLEERIARLREERDRVRDGHERYMRNERTAAQLKGLKGDLARKGFELGELEQERELMNARLSSLKSKFDRDLLHKLQGEVNELNAQLATAQEKSKGIKRERERLERQIEEMEGIMRQIEEMERRKKENEGALKLLSFLRNRVLNVAGERIASRYRQSIAQEASRLYREISGEPVTLKWDDSFEIILVDRAGKKERRRGFRQLSGGEQMSAALAIRLALLSFLSDTRMGIFDEPTVNLDEDRRLNLARAIPSAVRNFSQLFIISHDDSFDSITENVIRLEKDERVGSRLVI